ncbi:TraM recognition domain-containing protein [Fibrella sp. HMF5335]|uniref:TraM recognition domain-containing protein n=1 Tax=Fibrella rubiginis TaxID=2817060 RepID=A0A939K0T2_9BACT|nr:conjugal transfer protein MobC [Fibrella rubiginis]MBO0936427.1 TraM recognition domain-containing protein [Fibrella rubiginis]
MSAEQDKEYRGILSVILYLAFAVIAGHLYFYGYETWQRQGLSHAVLDRFLVNLNNNLHVLERPGISKLIALVPLSVYVFGNKAKKSLDITWRRVLIGLGIGLMLLFGNTGVMRWSWLEADTRTYVYVLTTLAGLLILIRAGNDANRIINIRVDKDLFNDENESFPQENALVENDYSINIPTQYSYRGRTWQGWVNVVNPFRAAMVLGTPGSGKTFAVINNYIRQHIMKGFAMYIYDFKFPDLSTVAYNYLLQHYQQYDVKPRFYVINFDDPRRSHRCNPLSPEGMTDIVDAQEAARTILLNLNKTWIQRQGDFFVESPMNFLTACIWFLKKYKDGRYCTFPHVIEFANREYDKIFPVLLAERDVENYTIPFASALKKRAFEQLEGQIASARIPLARLASPALYWVMTGDDFTLEINDPMAPKILCVGNNPARQEVYGAALGLYNARLVRLVNRKGRLKSSIIIDELPTIYFRGLDNLIATARSNKVSTCLGLQDLSQLKRDYGDKEATVIFNTVGNVFSGQVVGETAKTLSTRFGKIVQRRQSYTITERDTTTSISTQLDSLIPESKLSNLSQGFFVGAVADNFAETISQKIFHGQLVVDEQTQQEMATFRPIPELTDRAQLSDDALATLLEQNYRQVKTDIDTLLAEELNRIEQHPELNHLLVGS